MSSGTVTTLEKLMEHIRRAAIYNRHDLAIPTAILWPDGECLWKKIIPILLDAMPELLVLDESICNLRSGPATQIRYLLTRSATGTTPVVYMPGVSRLAFRGAAGFPQKARHLFALQYQGQFWTQANGKDWTPTAFLSSEDGGLGLDIARDQATMQAIAEQLDSIIRTKITNLQNRKLEAADIHGLIASDPTGLLLQWMADPDQVWAGWGQEKKSAFVSVCKQNFGFDPEKDGLIIAIEKLVRDNGIWEQVWHRFCEAPKAYSGIRKALDLVQSKDLFDVNNDRIPANNRRREEELRTGLLALKELPRSKAMTALDTLCREHSSRATTIWSEFGEAPLACAVIHLNEMITAMQSGMPGIDWKSMGESYEKNGWKVDSSSWKALASVREKHDIDAVNSALHGVYKPWLVELSERTDKLVLSYPNTAVSTCFTRTPTRGVVILFVDGLRCDLGFELSAKLAACGLAFESSTAWAGLPTVTATCKPAWQPLAEKLSGNSISASFEPQIRDSDQPLKTSDFRKMITELGWIWFEANSLGDTDGSGWTEIGTFDQYGHDIGSKLVWRIEEELNFTVQRICELLMHGWKEVIVMTDHGWLLFPGGLPKVDLPKHLTVSRWGRTAIAQPGAMHSYKEVPWFWGGGHAVILSPGIAVFRDGLEYAHGGITLQETLMPVIKVFQKNPAQSLDVCIVSYKWVGLRLQIVLEGANSNCIVDIRTKAADASTSVLSDNQKQKSIDLDGSITLVVENDSLIGQAAALVIISGNKIVAKDTITIGGN